MQNLSQQILRTDPSGLPLEWLDYQGAVKLYHAGQVTYASGSLVYVIRGGISARTGEQSVIEVQSIIATHGDHRKLTRSHARYTPPLNNHTLFKRDAHVCLYCGVHHPTSHLSRDHIRPLSRGGTDTWQNVVTACKRCNNHKAGRTPEQAGMQLLAVPFVPSHAEYIYLKGRRILADQMEFLRAHFPRNSPLRARLAQPA
jgi:5-methylcytosine-specific restriction endonuclease McrA